MPLYHIDFSPCFRDRNNAERGCDQTMAERKGDREEDEDSEEGSKNKTKHYIKNDKSWPNGIESQRRGVPKRKEHVALQFAFP